MHNSKVLYMLIGLPGCGKSTWVADHIELFHDDPVILSTDRYIEFVAQASGKTYNEVFKDSIKTAEDLMQSTLEMAIEADAPVIVWDQTNLSRKSRAKKLAKIPDDYVKVAVYFDTCCEDTIRERNAVRGNGRAISWNIIQKMVETKEAPDKSEGFDVLVRL